ncbi:MAG: AarF/UbiB family protein [Phycisphaerae bacterium]
MPRRFRFYRTVEHVRRYRHIMAVLMKYGFEDVVGSLGRRLTARLGRRVVPSRVKRAAEGRSRAARVRLTLQELGPTFIKLGQLLSTRPDLLPGEYIEELERLQDQVAPDRFPRVRAEIESQLGGKLEDIFESFEATPIAAGSIAQVHRAVTRDGRSVVVKARRPGIVETIRTECEILESLAGLLKAAFSDVETIDPQRMVREFTTAVMKEVDLANERRNQMRFVRNFAGDATVHVPQVHEEYCTEGVLTMEYIDGIKPNDDEAVERAGLDRRVLAQRGADLVFRQIFEFGFFHTDPHPGNFFFLPGNVVSPIDFGQMARLTADDRQLLRDLVLAIVDRDLPRLMRTFQRKGMLDAETDLDELIRDADEMIDLYYNVPLREIPFRGSISQAFELIRKHRIRPPAEFTMMMKSMMTIESFAVSLDHDFEVVEHLRPYARRFRLQQMDPRLVSRNLRKAVRELAELGARLPDDINTIVGKFRRGQLQVRVHHEHLENLAGMLDKSSNRISFALIIAALLVGSSLLVGQQEGVVLGLIRLQTLGILGYLAAAVMGIWLLVSIMRSRRL